MIWVRDYLFLLAFTFFPDDEEGPAYKLGKGKGPVLPVASPSSAPARTTPNRNDGVVDMVQLAPCPFRDPTSQSNRPI